MLYAKVDPDYSLSDHMEDVASTTKQLLNQQGRTKELQKAGKIAGLFHDLGKANPNWEKDARNGHPPHHSAISAALSTSLLKTDSFNLSDTTKYSIILAILHHHTKWTNRNMANESPSPKIIKDTINNINTNLEYAEINWSELFKDIHPEGLINMLDFVRNKKINQNEVMRNGLYIYSALRQSDWHESSKTGSGDISPLPRTVSNEKLSEFEELRPFQNKINQNSDVKSLIGLAGCGEGKTYSAVLWGKSQINKGNANRLIFAMPTQVTTNNLYNKIRELSSPKDVSLYHSSANIFQQEIDTENEEEKPSEKIDVDQAELYQAPFNITTVDHLIDSFVSNYDKSPISYTNIENSAIVFDEIHAYNEKTVGNILGLIKECERKNIPYYVMSATIPDQIRSEINPDNTIISSGALNSSKERSPFTIEVYNKELTTDVILDNITAQSNKIMVVKNTVREAQKLAKNLRERTNEEVSVYYYSSEFTQKDRKQKEKEITSKFKVGSTHTSTDILVCTQICEISLDLSADLLLTDIAPIDSIFQRAGRLHRLGEKTQSDKCSCKDCQVKEDNFKYKTQVYDTTKQKDHIYPYAENRESKEFKLLSKTANVLKSFGKYAFSKSVKSTTEAYSEYDFDFDSKNSFENEKDIETSYFKNRTQRYNIRNIQNRRTNILPAEYKLNESTESPTTLFHKTLEKENPTIRDIKLFIQMYSVPVPNYWIYSDDYLTQKSDELHPETPSPIYDLEYSYKNGVLPPRKRSNTDSTEDFPTL